MMTDRIMKELEANRVDKDVSDAEIDNYKKKFANDILDHVGKDITYYNIYNKPREIKKPLSLRLKEIIAKIKIVLGWNCDTYIN